MGISHLYIFLFSIASCASIVKGQSWSKEFLDLYTLNPNSVSASFEEGHSFLAYNLTTISERCPKTAFFSGFDPSHADAVDILTQYFIEQGNEEQLGGFAKYCKTNRDIHPKIWYEAITKARLVIPTPKYPPVNPALLFPTSFFPQSLLQNDTTDTCVVLDETFGADNGIENLLWYFREDVMLNAHHWIWHLLNPWNSNITRTIDRRGESFYFFHHDILARYTAERLSNGLRLQAPLNAVHKDTILEEGYKSHLHEGIANVNYPDRQPFRHIFDSIPPNARPLFLSVSKEQDRVVDTLNQGGVLHNDGFLELNAFDRINILGDISEASIFSFNPNLYGNRGFHNQGHNFIAAVDAPPETRGPMIGSETAMRDIIFYRWHKWIDIFFQSYKLTHLKPYALKHGEYPLIYDGILVNNVKVVPQQRFLGQPIAVNHLETFWNMKELDLGTGLDFIERRSLNICAKHLDHQEFEYQINIENSLDHNALATVRIFMAPRFDNKHKRYKMVKQRSLFFTMDSFQTILSPGNNELIRKSTDSTLTAGWPRSLKEIEEGIMLNDTSVSECECGYPHHLLLPKGNPKGMVFDLFVMVTNGREDQVSDTSSTPVFNNDKCIPSHIHCGRQGRKYPDKKPMGYPFDRKPYSVKDLIAYPSGETKEIKRVVKDLEEYVYHVPNMHASQVIIQHHNELRSKI